MTPQVRTVTVTGMHRDSELRTVMPYRSVTETITALTCTITDHHGPRNG